MSDSSAAEESHARRHAFPEEVSAMVPGRTCGREEGGDEGGERGRVKERRGVGRRERERER
eukprot:1990719-Rhodomonas_salina.1